MTPRQLPFVILISICFICWCYIISYHWKLIRSNTGNQLNIAISTKVEPMVQKRNQTLPPRAFVNDFGFVYKKPQSIKQLNDSFADQKELDLVSHINEISAENEHASEFFDMTKVVNLPFRNTKWLQMEKQLKMSTVLREKPILRSLGVVGKDMNLVKFYTDGKLSDGAYRSLIYPRTIGGMYMTPGGMGCLLSHVELWRQAALLERPMIIYEDDIQIIPSFDQLFSDIVKELPKDFGLFYFADMVDNYNTRYAASNYSTHLYQLSGEHWGTYAYMISPMAARALYDGVYPIRYQVDSYMIETCRLNNIKVFRSKTNLVQTDNDPNRKSDVQLKAHPDAEKTLVPLIFHVLAILPNVDVDQLVYRMRYKKNGEKRPNREIRVWDRQAIKALSPELARIRIEDPLHDLKVFHLQLNILERHGGLFLRSDFRSKFRIAKALKGLSGFLGYSVNADVSISFPLVGMVENSTQTRQIIQTVETAIKTYPLDHVRASTAVLNYLIEFLATMPRANDTLLFPMTLLSSKSLT